MNRVRLQDPVLEQACERSGVRYEDLGLPQELTVWVDPGEVSCRFALIISHLAFVTCSDAAGYIVSKSSVLFGFTSNLLTRW